MKILNSFTILICFIFLFNSFLKAQSVMGYGSQISLINLALPAEILVTNTNEKRKINYNLKLGYITYSKSLPTEKLNPKNYVYNSSFSLSLLTSAFYIKPGISIPINKSLKFENNINIYLCLTYSINKLTIRYDDPLLGKTITNYEEVDYHKGLEFEYLHIRKLSKKFNINLDLQAGFKLNRPKLFSNIIPNYTNVTSFDPGQGFGNTFYANFSIGLLFHNK